VTLYQTDEQAKENAQMLVDLGIEATWDDAIHALVDMGEISEIQHAHLLSKEEAERIYG
jgi:hypothetical protein